MSQRKSARKVEQGSPRNLRLVPPLESKPAPKRRRRKVRFKIGRIRKRKYEDRRELHAYENELILTAIESKYGGSASAFYMAQHEPERWHAKELGKALKRMRRERLLTGGGVSWFSGGHHIVYSIPPPPPDTEGNEDA